MPWALVTSHWQGGPGGGCRWHCGRSRTRHGPCPRRSGRVGESCHEAMCWPVVAAVSMLPSISLSHKCTCQQICCGYSVRLWAIDTHTFRDIACACHMFITHVHCSLLHTPQYNHRWARGSSPRLSLLHHRGTSTRCFTRGPPTRCAPSSTPGVPSELSRRTMFSTG